MIIGIGSDVIAVERVERLLIWRKRAFLQKILTKNEISLLDNVNIVRLAGYVANRFAAKEAFSKALGTGIGQYASFLDIEILKTSIGKPYFEFSDKLKGFLKENYGDSVKIHVSMSNEAEYAQAFVIIESN